MKNSKKGFTLVELLAVIVILAILILLALPTVLKIMDKAKKDTFKTEALSILKAAETKVVAEGNLGTSNIIPCLDYKGSNNELVGYIKHKKGYHGAIYKAGEELTINISNGTYSIFGLTKENEKEKKVIKATFSENEEVFLSCSVSLFNYIDAISFVSKAEKALRQEILPILKRIKELTYLVPTDPSSYYEIVSLAQKIDSVGNNTKYNGFKIFSEEGITFCLLYPNNCLSIVMDNVSMESLDITLDQLEDFEVEGYIENLNIAISDMEDLYARTGAIINRLRHTMIQLT